MVYLDHAMASCMAEPGSSMSGSMSCSTKAGKMIRNMPGISKKSKKVNEEGDEAILNKYKCNIDPKKLLFMRNLLKSEVIVYWSLTIKTNLIRF